MATTNLRLAPSLPDVAARLLEARAFGDGFLGLVSAGFSEGADRRFRHALVRWDAALVVRGVLWLASLPSTADSPWKEGNARLSIADDRLVSVTTKCGRGLWVDLETREVVARFDAEGDAAVAPAGPGIWARDGQGTTLGVLGTTERGRRSVMCRQLVTADLTALDRAPASWSPVSGYDAEAVAPGLHCPWIHHVEALGDARWLVGVCTDGSMRSAYPSKSMPFGYAVVDAQGAVVARLDHAAASEQRAVDVHADVGEPLFPDDLHPFYRPVVDKARGRIVHKLLDQLLCFDLQGRLVEQVDFKEKGLSGLRKFQLQAVSHDGHALFSRTEHAAVWSVGLGEGAGLRSELVAGLKAYRKEHKALGGGRLSVGVVGDDAWVADV